MSKERENSLNHQQAHHYLDVGREQLLTAEQAALDSHLTGCADCRRYAGEVSDLQSRLAETMRLRWNKYTPGLSINERVRARLRRKIWQQQLWHFTNSIAAAAAMLILVVTVGWLAWRIRPLPDTPVAGISLTRPATSQAPAPAADWSTLPGLETFGDQVKLLGYSMSATAFWPGNTVEMTLYWQTRSDNYTFFAYLLDTENRLVTQTDAPGPAAACPQVSQHSVDLVVTCASLALPNTLPAGSYQLRVGVYDRSNGQRLTTPDGQESFLLRSLRISPLPGPTLAPTSTPFPIPASCPVTLPNGNPPPGEPPSTTYHGNGLLWTALWPDGLVLIPPLMVQPDGMLGMKWGWWRGTNGRLSIEGRRLDAAASPLGEVIPDGYGDTGFQPGGLIFPTEGCWEVTGKVGPAELTFVVYVVKEP